MLSKEFRNETAEFKSSCRTRRAGHGRGSSLTFGKNMDFVRRLLFVPVSAIVGVVAGFTWAAVFSRASYSEHNLFYSIVGLAPSFLGRLLAVAIFVVLGTIIAPRPRRPTVIVLGFLGGIFGWPFGPTYEVSTSGPTFYLIEGVGAICGAGIGMLIGFSIARRKKKPNKAPEPTTMAVTPRAIETDSK